MPIDIYLFGKSSPCRAVLMTARQLNIPLNFKNVDLGTGEQMAPDFIKLNPAHSVPTIVDNGLVLWESRAIMQYLCNQYAPNSSLYPKEPKERAIVDRWLNFDMTLSASRSEVLISKVFLGVEPTEDKVNALKNNLKLLDQLIGGNKYLTGTDLTIADFSVLGSIQYAEFIQINLADYPNLNRWSTALKSELPYYEEINHSENSEILAHVDKVKALLQQKANQ